MNLYLTQTMRLEPQNIPQNSVLGRPFPKAGPLSQEQRERVRQIRLNDLQNFQELSFLSIIPITLISFLIGYLASAKFLQPISNLSNKIKVINSDKLGEIIQIQSKDEIGELIQSFNQMSEKLKKSFDIQQKFVQDAAHELKTPLTIIQTSIETSLQDSQVTKPELIEVMEDSLSGVKRLSKLTNDLLDLTRPFEMIDEINILEIIKNQVEMLEQYAQNNSTKVSIINPENMKIKNIKGNSMQLSRAFYNIIQNAIKYSKHNLESYLKIEIVQDKESLRIRFEDNGLGIKQEEGQKIFNRFYRIIKSEDGNGLGLSIAKEIVTSHGGRIELIPSEVGAVFEVRF
jgi:signal transduction histidine kinase